MLVNGQELYKTEVVKDKRDKRWYLIDANDWHCGTYTPNLITKKGKLDYNHDYMNFWYYKANYTKPYDYEKLPQYIKNILLDRLEKQNEFYN